MRCDKIETYYLEAKSKKELKRKFQHILKIKVVVDSYGDGTSLYEVKFARPIYVGELEIIYG